MPINTVLGTIAPEELGVTSMHEHLLVDATIWTRPPRETAPTIPTVSIDNLGFLRWNSECLEDNLRLDDPTLIASELLAVREVGGSGILDLTCCGLGTRPELLPEIARRTGLNIMLGCGFYVHDSHPDWLEAAPVDRITAFIVSELDRGVAQSGIRPAVIGEIGTSSPVTTREERVIRAAGQASGLSGAAVNIHLDLTGTHAIQILDLLVAEGASPGRVIFSHMDATLDVSYHREVAQTGATLSFDTFGLEGHFATPDGLPVMRTDLERLASVARLLEEGFCDQIVLGCDIYTKGQLRAYGGMGYDHLLRRIVPALKRYYDVSDDTLDRILIATPRRLLDRPLALVSGTPAQAMRH